MAERGRNSGHQAEAHDGTNDRNVPEPGFGTGDLTVTVPRGLRSSNHNQRKKLVLHIDLNNTILVSDAVTGQGTVAALDYFLTTVTWGKMSKQGKLEIVRTLTYHTRMLGMCVCSVSVCIVPEVSKEHARSMLNILYKRPPPPLLYLELVNQSTKKPAMLQK